MVEKPFELNREAPPPAVPDRDLETEKSRPLRRDDGTRWSQRARVLYGCAAVIAVVVGVLPALWINRWREPAASRIGPEASHGETASPQVAAPAPAAETPAAEVAPVAPEDIEIAPPEPTVPAVTPRASADKTVKSARAKAERSKPPVRPKKAAAPPCDVYLHPKGCPR